MGKVKHGRPGICTDCAGYFAHFGNLSNQILESFLEYKKSKGWNKKRVDPMVVSLEKYVHPNILNTLLDSAQPFRPHSPMRAGPSNSNNHPLHLQPPPAVRPTKSAERRAERRPPTAFEHTVKPVSECSYDNNEDGEFTEIPLSDPYINAGDGNSIPLQPIPRGHSVSPCSIVRRITDEAERLYPNPESPAFPGVPKLTAPPKHRRGRRLPRGTDETAAAEAAAAAKSATTFPVVVLKAPASDSDLGIAGAVLSPPASDVSIPITAAKAAAIVSAGLDHSDGNGERRRRHLFAPGGVSAATGEKSALVRALSLETLAESQIEPAPRCAQHPGDAHDFACGGCRSTMFREQRFLVTTTDEHGNQRRVRSRSVAVPAGQRASFYPEESEGGWI
ncbi:hypothetical protein SLS62_001466 [Diatrype stigma]|uniref:Uncharacterized protein n=1 Tax=Diatrype stigma TaxID=117547 RepID=A0AAN9V8Q7_9PEZI